MGGGFLPAVLASGMGTVVALLYPPFSHWLLINYSLLNPEVRGTRFSDKNAEGRAGRGLAEAPVSEASAPALPWTTSGCPGGAQNKGWRKVGGSLAPEG